jgi:hypothetical protein
MTEKNTTLEENLLGLVGEEKTLFISATNKALRI